MKSISIWGCEWLLSNEGTDLLDKRIKERVFFFSLRNPLVFIYFILDHFSRFVLARMQ